MIISDDSFRIRPTPHEVQLARQQSDVSHLINGPPDTRLDRRREVRQRLKEIEVAERNRNDIKKQVADLEARLNAALESHQRRAAAIHKHLQNGTPAARRIELRQELATINSELEQAAADLNGKLQAAELEQQILSVHCGTRSQLEQGLITTGDPAKLRELTVAENTTRWAKERVKSATQQRDELRDMLEYGEGGNASFFAGWAREDLEERHRMGRAELERLKDRLETAELEFQVASEALAAAEAAERELREAIARE